MEKPTNTRQSSQVINPTQSTKERAAVASIASSVAATAEGSLKKTLLWLADAPLFIDADQVGRFHDAVVRPEYEPGTSTLELTKENAKTVAGKLGLGAKVEPNDVLKALTTFLPFVKAELSVSGELGVDSQEQSRTSETMEFRRITTPQRQLEQLVLHYLVNHTGRLFEVYDLGQSDWRDPSAAIEVPRGLVLIDFPPQTQFIPTAAEFGNGTIEEIYKRMTSKDGRQSPPTYPDPYPVTDSEKLKADREEYWNWFAQNFSATKAMLAVENSGIERGGIRWIDYRVPITPTGATVHLHFSPAGKYDVGIFAYYLIKRGFKHGVRIVGTLKSEPAINVLAVYEK